MDTATHWSTFGKVVIIGLIQIGGLGIMSMASLLGLLLARKIGFRSRLNAAAEGRTFAIGDVRSVIKYTLLFTVAIEATFAVILAARFVIGYDYGIGKAIWFGTFHSISAFNNAGFALYTDNFIGFVGDPCIILPLSAALIVGGFGFPVLIELLRRSRGIRGVWSINTKIVLFASLGLLVLGMAMVLALEWNGALRGLDAPSKLLAAFFQGTAPRTAGFNSVDYAQMQDATLLGTDVLMFIGGGSGGTAGGIKVATFVLLCAVVLAEIRGERSVILFGRRIDPRVQRQALTVATLSVLLVVTAAMLLLTMTDFDSSDVIFEVTSAFATVGLSTGITAQLPQAGQLLLVVLMFLGRVGPITLVSSLAGRERGRLYEYPTERPLIG